MSTDQPLSHDDLSQDPDLHDWRVVLSTLRTRFRTGQGGFSAGARFAARVAEVADRMDHHPDIDLRYPHVTVTTISHDVGALTERDRRLAIEISAVAAELGLAAAPEEVSILEIGLDVRQAAAVAPFWRAVLGYDAADEDDEESSLVDPGSAQASLWFQQMDEERPQRKRFHLDINVPHDVAQDRVSAGLDAGGRLVTDRFAPSWWVLADAEGNEACVCTWRGRGEDAGMQGDEARQEPPKEDR